MRRIAIVGAVLMAGGVLAGCDGNEAGTAVATSTVSAVDLFDPCTLPDDAVRAAGANPSDRDDNPWGTPQTGWKGCSWRAPDHFFGVAATTRTIEEFRANTYQRDVRDERVANRDAIVFLQGRNTTSADNCTVAFASGRGTVEVVVRAFVDSTASADLCPVAVRATETVQQWLPR